MLEFFYGVILLGMVVAVLVMVGTTLISIFKRRGQ